MTALTRRWTWWVATGLVVALVMTTPALADEKLPGLRALMAVDDPPLGETPPSSVPDLQPNKDPAKASASSGDDDSVFGKWWFWALTAAVVGGTVALGAWAVQPSTPQAAGCTNGTRVCFGAGRP